MPRLVLFDVDGTLVRAGGAASRAYARAFQEVLGVAPSLDEIPLTGRTDPEILHEILGRRGFTREALKPHLRRIHELYQRFLEVELGNGDELELLPGLPACLDVLERRGANLALLTGNVESGARTKISFFGLNRYFLFGAFGDDAEERERLVDIAIARARERTGIEFLGKEVVIVGDSPRDVECGRHRGVTSVAVATGWTSADELAAAGADEVLASFADVERAVAVILGG